ncbi:MAG: mechanosensitive ion channel family protein [Pseudomonadota bacterium]
MSLIRVCAPKPIDDAFRVGEYIDIGSVKGTVEKISVRSMQLRHQLGTLVTVPFGEIQHLSNFSRDWVIMKLPLRLTYDTDINKVNKLIKNLGKELLSHELIGDKFLEPLKSQGVWMMEDSAMIIRVKFMTRPGDQFQVRKIAYAEIRSLFEREGIQFASREVKVRLDDNSTDRELSEADKAKIGAAVRPILDEGQQAGGPPADQR